MALQSLMDVNFKHSEQNTPNVIAVTIFLLANTEDALGGLGVVSSSR